MAQQDNTSPKKQQPTSQLNLLLRCLIGAYLIYLAFSVRDNFDQILFIVFAVIFAVAGVALIVTSVRRIFRGDYDLLDSQGNVIEPDDLDDLDDLDGLELELPSESDSPSPDSPTGQDKASETEED